MKMHVQGKWLQGMAALVAAVAFGVAGTAGAAEQAVAASNVKLVKPGTLTVCTHLPYRPFEYVDAGGQVIGFDVDLVNLLAKRLGVESHFISIDWNQIISGLVFASGKCDLAMGGATITDERNNAVQFSMPYFDSDQAMLVKADSGIKSLADLKGKKFGVQVATTGEIYANQHAKEFGYSIVIYEDLALLSSAVSSGAVAAAIDDYGPFAIYAQDHPDTAVSATFPTGEYLGFIGKKDDANARRIITNMNIALWNAINDGSYQQLHDKWFGAMRAGN